MVKLSSLSNKKIIFPINRTRANGSSLNDVTQVWTIFDPPPPIVTLFLFLRPQYCWHKILYPLPPPPPPKTMTTFMDDPKAQQEVFVLLSKNKKCWIDGHDETKQTRFDLWKKLFCSVRIGFPDQRVATSLLTSKAEE